MSLTRLFAAALIGAASASSAALAQDATPDDMIDHCRKHAAQELGVHAGKINVSYEGTRTDGTHPVNGEVDMTPVTFQCSFGPQGKKIQDFTVNNRKALECPPDVSEADRGKYPGCG